MYLLYTSKEVLILRINFVIVIKGETFESYSKKNSTLKIILLLYAGAHIFILEIRICYHIMLVLLLSMHLLLDYCNSIRYNVPRSETDQLQKILNQCSHIWTKSPCREHITPVLKKLH